MLFCKLLQKCNIIINLNTSFLSVSQSYSEGDIRLVEGRYNWEGRVEIYVSGTWSTIYDTLWANSDAEVVCRQLGHLTEGTGTYAQTTMPSNNRYSL